MNIKNKIKKGPDRPAQRRSDAPTRKDRPDQGRGASPARQDRFDGRPSAAAAAAAPPPAAPPKGLPLLFPHIAAAEDEDFFRKLRAALDSALPMKGEHRRDLPTAVADLSTLLTGERAGLGARPYWASPRFTAAYLHYFMPWNIIRLRNLLAGLNLPLPAPGEQPPSLLDIGSGPLSMPLALWLAYPAWRAVPLHFMCVDAAPRPLELGRAVFYALAGENCPWRVKTRKASLTGLRRELSGGHQYIFSANVLNEWLSARRAKAAGEGGATMGGRLAALLQDICALLAPRGSALFVEPGTRLGGKTVESLRDAALRAGYEEDEYEEADIFAPQGKMKARAQAPELVPLAPCPHHNPCPLAGSKTWCHFTFKPRFTPQWLEALSAASGLPKDALSLSFALLQKNGKTAPGNEARIISAPFAVPGLAGQARYACTARGLVLIENAERLPSGALPKVEFPAAPRRDKKSGAMVLKGPQ